MPPPPAPESSPNLPVNVNFVYGFSTAGPQEWMPPLAYLGLLMVALPLLLFWPTHLMLMRAFGRPENP